MADVIEWPEKLKVQGGDSWSQDFEFGTYTDPDDLESWVADDLSDWSAWRSQWRKAETDSAFIDLTVTSTDAVNGVVTVSATPLQTAAMNGPGGFDIQASQGPGEVRTFVRARTSWKLGYTRD